MKELLQKIYELILEPVVELLRKLWEMPAGDFLSLIWAVMGPLLKFFGIVIAGLFILIIIVAIVGGIVEAIADHRKRNNQS